MLLTQCSAHWRPRTSAGDRRWAGYGFADRLDGDARQSGEGITDRNQLAVSTTAAMVRFHASFRRSSSLPLEQLLHKAPAFPSTSSFTVSLTIRSDDRINDSASFLKRFHHDGLRLVRVTRGGGKREREGQPELR